jgi:hypothetical protein
MSVALQKWAWSAKAGGMLEKLVLVTLAGLADCRGSCWPVGQELAESAEASEGEIALALDRLEARGLIYRAPPKRIGVKAEGVVLADALCWEYARRLGWRGDQASVGGAP